MEQTSENRDKFIRALLWDHFKREVTGLSTLGRDSNNFVYQVDLASNHEENIATTSPAVKIKPGIVPLPVDVSKVVIRISNPNALVNHETRIENEVAAMMLMRDALSSYSSQLVPQVYYWSSDTPPADNTIAGYILQEHKPGVGLDGSFGLHSSNGEKLSFEEYPEDKKRDLLRQIAEVLKLIQSYELPFSVKGYGGLRFDEVGRIVTGPTTIPCGGPFGSISELYTQTLRYQLGAADKSVDVVRGWHKNSAEREENTNDGDLRERLDKLLHQDGIANIVKENSIQRPTLVHGDFDIFNMLFDVETNRLTALLDFEFSHIASPAEEYLYSMASLGHLVLGPNEDGVEHQPVNYLVQGSQEYILSSEAEKDHGPWVTMKILNEELAGAGALRPQDIKGIWELAGVRWFLENVFPPYYASQKWLKKRTAEQIQKNKAGHEAKIRDCLERWGY